MVLPYPREVSFSLSLAQVNRIDENRSMGQGIQEWLDRWLFKRELGITLPQKELTG